MQLRQSVRIINKKTVTVFSIEPYFISEPSPLLFETLLSTLS